MWLRVQSEMFPLLEYLLRLLSRVEDVMTIQIEQLEHSPMLRDDNRKKKITETTGIHLACVATPVVQPRNAQGTLLGGRHVPNFPMRLSKSWQMRPRVCPNLPNLLGYFG